jgi:hypothetical protein
MLAQILLSIIIAILPGTPPGTLLGFATLPLVTGLSHIAAGFVQSARLEIAYFQQSLIIWIAAMGIGPAIIAWLRRAYGRTDMLFLLFTIAYLIAMSGFTFYTIYLEKLGNGVVKCFLGQVPHFYGEQYLKIFNLTITITCAVLVIISVITNCCQVSHRRRGTDWFYNVHGQPRLTTVWEWGLVVFVFIVEALVFVLVQETVDQYRNLLPMGAQADEEIWSFGQIVPFMMLIYPILVTFRSLFAEDNRSQMASSNASRNSKF